VINPGQPIEELYLSDELENGDSQNAPEYNGGALYSVALDDLADRANLTLLINLQGACASGLPAGVDCDVAFDKPHISATPDGARVYVVNRFRPSRAQDQPIYSGTPVGYYDVDLSSFVFQGMISGLPAEGSILAANSPAGDFYIANAQSNRLYRVDASSLAIAAQWPIVKSTGGALDVVGADIAFDAAGTLYLWTNTSAAGGADRGLYTVAIPEASGGNALATRIGGSSTSYFTGLAVREAGNGPLVGSSESDDAIFEISPVDGSIGTQYSMYLDGNPYDHRFGDMTTGRLVLPAPAIKLVKLTNGTDNNVPTGPIVAVGSTVTWTYNVTNTGNVPLTNVTVTDDKLGSDGIVCVGSTNNVIATLSPGATATCSATGTAVAGQYTNLGTATGTWNASTLTATDPDNYFAKATGTGTQGCTPGYWKQSQHFGSWKGYSPNQKFSTVFDNAFPGKTLLEVLGQGGGGLNALGRHTVAALLDASSGIDYGMAAEEVIAKFNAAYPGTDYETLKDQFAAMNERGCPLGR
jgi:hypothetical protein